MNKVGFRSIQFKITLIYVLLIIIAMQIIGVYFVKQVENSLLKSYELSLNQRIDNLSYYIEQEYKGDNDSTVIKDDVKRILNDFTKTMKYGRLHLLIKAMRSSVLRYGEEIAENRRLTRFLNGFSQQNSIFKNIMILKAKQSADFSKTCRHRESGSCRRDLCRGKYGRYL